MKNTKNGLNDSDRLMVTVALWIALISLFATSLTLPMLPSHIRNGVVTFDPETYSKYGNLFIVLASVVPVIIVLVAATLKKHNRMQHNFASMIIFCIMLSICMSGLTIFGIIKQMIASYKEKPLDPFTMTTVAITVVFSMACALIPRLFRTDWFLSRENVRPPLVSELCVRLDKYWYFGAYGYMLTGVIASFIPSPLAFIPLAVFMTVFAVIYFVFSKIAIKPKQGSTATDPEPSDAEPAQDNE